MDQIISINILNKMGEYLSSGTTVTGTVVLYLLFVKWLGPNIMLSRKPLNLKSALIAFNFYQVIANLYIVTMPLRYPKLLNSYWANCRSDGYTTYSNWEEEHAGWCFYVSKYFDLIDTVFFILRKKDKQITFLHVFHHAVVIPSNWYFQIYIKEPVYLPAQLINASVHAIMYTYYMISALGPRYHKYVWWKVYITRIQMIQFCTVVLIQLTQIMLGCRMQNSWAGYLLLTNVTFFFLFLNYYVAEYRRNENIKTS